MMIENLSSDCVMADSTCKCSAFVVA